MGTNIQIRSVPVELRNRLKRRAEKEGRSMSEYLVELIRRDLAVPTEREFYDRLRKQKPIEVAEPGWKTIRAVRGERERAIAKRIEKPRARKRG